jgi:hypothetical protein
MPPLSELRSSIANLPYRERIVRVAEFLMETAYSSDNRDGRAFDCVGGAKLRGAGPSGFVKNVFHVVFPEQGLAYRRDISAMTLQAVDLFVDVDDPANGDIICWEGHVGIVYDAGTGRFISSLPGSGVKIASFRDGYWATTRKPVKYRKWKSL